MAGNIQVQRPQLPATQPAPAPTSETASTVLAAQAKALVSARFEIAIRQPRDIDAVRERLLRECQRPSFAAVAIYRKPIGEGVEGPSIRFAEAAIQAMGNLAIDTPAIYDDAEKRILRVTVADMETNVVHSKDVTIMKRVERNRLGEGQIAIRTRVNSKGRTVFLVEATDDEILNQENALVSKALRTTGLRLVPGWLIDEAMVIVRATRAKGDAADPDAAKRKLLDAFRSVGVSAEQIKEWLGHPADTLAPAELEELRGIYTALRDGDTTWKEVMDAKWQEQVGAMDANAAAATPPATRTASLKEKIRAKTAAKATPAEEQEAMRRELDEEADAADDASAAEPPPSAGERKAPDDSAAREVRPAVTLDELADFARANPATRAADLVRQFSVSFNRAQAAIAAARAEGTRG
jgi:DNA-binding transcriptional MerR regulator